MIDVAGALGTFLPHQSFAEPGSMPGQESRTAADVLSSSSVNVFERERVKTEGKQDR